MHQAPKCENCSSYNFTRETIGETKFLVCEDCGLKVEEDLMMEEKQIAFKMDKEKADKIKIILKNEGMSVSTYFRLMALKSFDFENMTLKKEV